MIKKDQPTIFGSKIYAALSSRDDGNMKSSDLNCQDNLNYFIKKAKIPKSKIVRCHVTYNSNNFKRYLIVDKQTKTMSSTDAIMTQDKAIILTLPLGDCIGAIIFDEQTNSLMIAHLGRQNLEQDGGYDCIKSFCRNFGIDPIKLLVWLSPAPSRKTYAVWSLGRISLKAAAIKQLTKAGVKASNIQVCLATTTSHHSHYFSHCQFLNNHRLNDNRYIIAAKLK